MFVDHYEKDNFVEIPQEIQCLDDDTILLDVVNERVKNKQCSTQAMTLDELKNRHPEDYLDNKPSYGSEWDFLYW